MFNNPIEGQQNKTINLKLDNILNFMKNSYRPLTTIMYELYVSTEF